MVAGVYAVMGACWGLTVVLLKLGLYSPWWWYCVYGSAALVGGGILVAHAPLRPTREPALAGALAAAAMIGLTSWRADWMLAHTVPSWLVAVVVVAVSGALAAAGGLSVRGIAAATPTTARILILSALVLIGALGAAIQVTYDETFGLRALAGLGSVFIGGWITQAAVVPRRPWACGAGGLLLVLVSLSINDHTDAGDIAGAIFSGLIYVLLGAAGAALAWRLCRHNDPRWGPDVPRARLG